MTNENENNEPAYPSFQVRRVGNVEHIDVLHPGLSKREVFAAMIMQGYYSNDIHHGTAEAFASNAVAAADALLKELEK